LKSHGGSATDFYAKILYLLHIEVPESENLLLLPDLHDPFFEADENSNSRVLNSDEEQETKL
jgi:hypothetical protein